MPLAGSERRDSRMDEQELVRRYNVGGREFGNAYLVGTNLIWNGVTVFGKRLIEQGTPCAIYNVGSENSLFDGVPYGNAYVISKHAVLALTDTLRKEVADFVEVGLICPGLVNSELGEDGINFGMDTDRYTAIAMDQIKAGKFYIFSHAYNMKRIDDRYGEIREAYETYAPRCQGGAEFDARKIFAAMAAEGQGLTG
jgi:NAD(P)-dependent dehydrogenase (short-subunit alcohol dehydrogenase family)